MSAPQAIAYKNPRPQTHVRSQTGIFGYIAPAYCRMYGGSYMESSEGRCHAAASSFCFLIVSYVLLRFSKFLLFRLE